MRLLTILPSTLRGGCEEYALTVATHAVKRGWEVHAGFPTTEGTVELISDFRSRGIAFHSLAVGEKGEEATRLSRWHHGVCFVRTLACLRTIRPTIVHLVLPLPYFGLGVMLACAVHNVPVGVVFQLVSEQAHFGPKLLRAYRWLRSRNQVLVAVSHENRRHLCASFNISQNDIHVIPNGANVAAADSTPSDETRRALRRELGLSENTRLLLSVGRLNPQKGYLDLARVAPEILREFPDLKFAWVGEGPQRQQLEGAIREAGITEKVRLLGYRNDVPRLLRAADLFLFPSHYEGQSFALLEAMSAGLPIVSSDTSGIPEVIESGVHGVLYPARDRAALAGALRWALLNPESMRRMGQRAMDRARDFSEERMCDQTLSLLDGLARRRGGKKQSGRHQNRFEVPAERQAIGNLS